MLEENIKYHGVFHIDSHALWGELELSGPSSTLTLRTENDLESLVLPETIYGTLHDFTRVTCLMCVGSGVPSKRWNSDGQTSLSWALFPHQVLSGSKYFDPARDSIQRAYFSTTDAKRIFEDFHAFGVLRRPPEELAKLVPNIISTHAAPVGEDPAFVYFRGKKCILSAKLTIGNLEILHWVSPQASSEGAYIAGEVVFQLDLPADTSFSETLSRIYDIGQFLSLVAGRSQSLANIGIDFSQGNESIQGLALYRSFGLQDTNDIEIPHWRDTPLDGVREPAAFTQVIEQWFSSDENMVPRERLFACRQNGTSFTTDRLVAAANMFDLTYIPNRREVSSELAAARDECVKILKLTAQSDDRDSAIAALKRIGDLTLRKKILARANLVNDVFHLTRLDAVVRQAVLCRNFFVHGSDKAFDYIKVAGHTDFLTETLEFIFAASELIECGWNARGWRLRSHTGGHWFSRYISNYEISADELFEDLQE